MLMVRDVILVVCLMCMGCGGGGGGSSDGQTDGDAGDEPVGPVSASGHAFVFGPPGGRVEGGTVTVLEIPGLTTTTDADGYWEFPDLPGDALVSFVMHKEGHPLIQTGSIRLEGEDIEQVSFQSPTDDMFEFIENYTLVESDPTMCQVASTVTRRGHSLYDTEPGTHGEPGATVTVDPPLPAAHGPIYFNLVTYDMIFPDPDLEETSDDGGVLFVNVPPGDYVLTAHKPDTVFTEVVITCRAGVLVNAAPPWGLQAVEGGVGPRE